MSDELERFPLLAGLGEDERRDLAQELEWLSYEAGARIFREGDTADGLFLLLEGRVRLSSAGVEEGGECGPGTSFGSLSLVLGARRRASLEARTPCRILRLSRESFERLAGSSPGAARHLLEGVVRESADLVERVLEELRD